MYSLLVLYVEKGEESDHSPPDVVMLVLLLAARYYAFIVNQLETVSRVRQCCCVVGGYIEREPRELPHGEREASRR